MSANDYRAEERAAKDEAEKAAAEACKAIEATERADAADIVENYTEPEQTTERKSAEPEHTAQISEATKNASRAAADAGKAAAERATLEAKQDASFAACEAYDARITAENTYNLATVEELAKKADEAAKKAEEAADKAESEARKADSTRAATIAKLAREQAKKARHNAHLAAMEAEERRRYAADLEEEAKADAAAASFCAAYEKATGNPPYFEEAASVCRVARAEIANESGATSRDRETVAYMLEAIAQRNRR